MPEDKPYSVNLWGSLPARRNDDCWTGHNYGSERAARAAMDILLRGDLPAGWSKGLGPTLLQDTTYIELDGPDVHEERKTPWAAKAESYHRRGDDDWRHERAMQAGMGLGVDAYNEEMGWDVE